MTERTLALGRGGGAGLAGLLAERAQDKLNAVTRLADEIADGSLSLDDIAARCDVAARDLVGAASLLRRISMQQKKSGAAGAATKAPTEGETPCTPPK